MVVVSPKLAAYAVVGNRTDDDVVIMHRCICFVATIGDNEFCPIFCISFKA